MELDPSRAKDVVPVPASTTPDTSIVDQFNASKQIVLVPPFREGEVDSYFTAFERIATTLKWPKDVWSLLLQCKLVGRAQEVCASLSIADSLDYEIVKSTILRAYELVPEAYRQKFHACRKSDSQTFVEFAREKAVLFDKWLAASKAEDFTQLKELILLEEFKTCLPENIVVYINEQKVGLLSKAAVLADEFVLTHRAALSTARREYASATHAKSCRISPKRQRRSAAIPVSDCKCFYCHEIGHLIAACPSLQRKEQAHTVRKPKSVGFVRSMSASTSPDNEVRSDSLDDSYRPFVLEGFVSLNGKEEDRVPITILRDTGAAQTLILRGILPFSDVSFCGSDALVWGVKMDVLRVPLHNVFLQSLLVSGLLTVGVRDHFPVPGVAMILGNDLANGKVFSAPRVVENPVPDTLLSDLAAERSPSVFPACAVTRAHKRKYGDVDLSDSFLCAGGEPESESKTCDPLMGDSEAMLSVNPSVTSQLPSGVNKKDFVLAQLSDSTLVGCFSAAHSSDQYPRVYSVEDDVLMRTWYPPAAGDLGWNVSKQVLVPLQYRPKVLSLAHDNFSGHLGIRKTYHRILRHFFWPGLKNDVAKYCRSCHTCQISGKRNQVIPPAPLHPIPVLGEPFEHILIDCVGPLPKTKSSHQYLLTLMCVATRFPKAIPLRTLKVKSVVKALVNFFSTFGLPKVVQTDQGSNFMCKIFAQVLQSLGIKHQKSSAYHPESQGALERFHQTLKSMMRKFCLESEKEWDEGLPLLLLAVRESVQESLGFSPAELVFGHTVRGPLQLLKENFLSDTDAPKVNVLDYVSSFRERLHKACAIARNALVAAQGKMKRKFDKKAVQRKFEVGDKVLTLLSVPGSSFQAKFSGPYTVQAKLSDTDYVIDTPERRKKCRVCHINMMKPYFASGVSAVATVGVPGSETRYDPRSDDLVVGCAVDCARLRNSEILRDLGSHLTEVDDDVRNDVCRLIENHPNLFSDTPSRTTVLEHDIDVGDHPPIKQHAYRVNPTKRALFQTEVSYLLENCLAVPSSSAWSSPCLLVPKADKTPRFCTDFRKVNSVTKPDSYPLPRMEDCVDRVGSAKFVTKLDLLKGYWQVLLTSHAAEISAFVTPDHFLQYTVMPFGLRNAPATFQRLMNIVLGSVRQCEVYLDDIVVYSDTWSEHMETLADVFHRLEWASLTLNLAKCDFGKAMVTYLGKQVGQGQVRPILAKIQAILDFPAPRTRRELRNFLGMVGYYRGFCRNFAEVVAPLTSLTSVLKPFVWSSACQSAFLAVKTLLCSAPVLAAPDFARPFKLEVDASANGAGAVLLQEDQYGVAHPIGYFSKKFNVHQRRYGTIEKEALSLLFALQHFEVYVGSSPSPVIVYTDHNPLVFLMRMQNSNQRLMRWSLLVQDFNLEIRHKKGTENVLADALSRVFL
uniref:Gypsy retrotransposon integrase-like protein 1 n=1 Tax=Oreochromis niloticus TaxID=8128 RepID=A0A669CU45_ORENI